MRVRFTPSAEASHRVHSKRQPVGRGAVLQTCREDSEAPGDVPGFRKAATRVPDLPHREIIVSPYRFFYPVVEDTVWIVGVWHGAQIPKQTTLSRPGLRTTGSFVWTELLKVLLEVCAHVCADD